MENGQGVPHDLELASRREWLITDGAGGYAAGTASGAPTRRTHALLAAAGPHGALTSLLMRFEEKLVVNGVTHDLSASFTARPGAPLQSRAGALADLESFTAEPFPVWRWRFGDTRIERSFRLIEGHQAHIATWRLLEGSEARISVAPLLTSRAPFALLRETPDFRGAAHGIPGRVRITTLGDDTVTLWHNGAFLPARGWAKGLAYPLERGGMDGGEATVPTPSEDAYLPGWVQALLSAPGQALHVVLSPEESLFRALATEGRLGTPPAQTLADCAAALERNTRERHSAWRRRALAGADLTARQAAAAHGGADETIARRSEPLVPEHDVLTRALSADLLDGLVRRHGRVTAVAAWPEGLERGSAALRAACALVTLRAFEPARAIARGYIEYLDEGLAPQTFDPIDGTPIYGDPEPSLWLVYLVDLLARRQGVAAEDAFLRNTAWPALEGVLQHLRQGSRHGVRCDRDGLLWCGEGDAACAKAGLNALWYRALIGMAQLGKQLGRRENAAFYIAWAHELQRHFSERFWDEQAGSLYVALTSQGPVRGITPEQLYAARMAPSLLEPRKAQRLVDTIEEELFAHDADPRQMHEWLGPWASGLLRAHERSAHAEARVRERFESLERRIAGQERLPGTGNTRVRPVLASAEILRVWIEDVSRSEAGVVTAS
jgi:hypothetical protein